MPHPATWPRPVLPRDCRALPAGDRPGGPTHRDAPCRRLPQSWCPASAAGAPHWQRGHCPSLLLMHCPKLVVFFLVSSPAPNPSPRSLPHRGNWGLLPGAAKALQAERAARPPGVPRGLRAARPPVELLKQRPAPGVTLPWVCAHRAGCPGAQPHLRAKSWGLA